ncbi:hypothetical protein F4703DRAFT_1862318 [Phycomyces blakesleeanus]
MLFTSTTTQENDTLWSGHQPQSEGSLFRINSMVHTERGFQTPYSAHIELPEQPIKPLPKVPIESHLPQRHPMLFDSFVPRSDYGTLERRWNYIETPTMPLSPQQSSCYVGHYNPQATNTSLSQSNGLYNTLSPWNSIRHTTIIDTMPLQQPTLPAWVSCDLDRTESMKIEVPSSAEEYTSLPFEAQSQIQPIKLQKPFDPSVHPSSSAKPNEQEENQVEEDQETPRVKDITSGLTAISLDHSSNIHLPHTPDRENYKDRNVKVMRTSLNIPSSRSSMDVNSALGHSTPGTSVTSDHLIPDKFTPDQVGDEDDSDNFSQESSDEVIYERMHLQSDSVYENVPTSIKPRLSIRTTRPIDINQVHLTQPSNGNYNRTGPINPAQIGTSHHSPLTRIPPVHSLSADPARPRLTIGSISLVRSEESIKDFSRMAGKTKDPNTQMVYASYLLEIADLYQVPALSTSIRHALLKEACTWIERLAKSGIPEALLIQGRWYQLGHAAPDCVGRKYVKINTAKALKCYQQASNAGLKDASYALAAYWKSQNDWLKASSYYQSASQKGHILAKYELARLTFDHRVENSNDVKTGLKLLLESARSEVKDSAAACFMLSCIYGRHFGLVGLTEDPEFGPFDPTNAYFYLSKAVRMGHLDAIHKMGEVWELGLWDKTSDIEKAIEYYTRAAQESHPGSMFELVKIYSGQIDYPSQPEQAILWCQRASDKGYAKADYLLGLYYEEGLNGLEIDYPRALGYFTKAASNGYTEAQARLNIPINMVPENTPHNNQGRFERAAKRLSSARINCDLM